MKRRVMKNKKLFVQLLVIVLLGTLTFGFPGVAMAQETDPPTLEAQEVDDTPENDVLVFEPQFFWELPFTQGFKITFNFGISFEFPMDLTLVSEEAFNLILRFRSYIREDALELPGSPEDVPTPEP
jgi:hypothetical protein